MKKLILVAILTGIAGSAFAEDKIISIEGTEISYIFNAVEEENRIVLRPATVFVGERIVKDDSGVCSKETSVLNAMNKVSNMGMEVEKPDVSVRRVQVVCPI